MCKRKLIPASILTLVYNMSCLYAVLYCSYCSMRPIYDFFHNSANSFRKVFLDIDEGTVALFLQILLIGTISAIILFVIYKNKPIRIILFISLIQNLILFSTVHLYSDYIINGEIMFIKQLYWLLIIGFLISSVYSILFLKKTIKEQ